MADKGKDDVSFFGALAGIANGLDIFSGPGQSGPNNTAGDASHTQSGGLFGGGSSGSSEQKGSTTVHRDSKGTETGRTEQHGDSLTHFDSGSSFFGGLDSQQTGRSEVNGNRTTHHDNSGNVVGWSIAHGNKTDNYDSNGNRTHTSHSSARSTSETIPARIGNGLSAVARQISDSAPWSTWGPVETNGNSGRRNFGRNEPTAWPTIPSIRVDWGLMGRLALAVLILSLFVGLCRAVVRSMNGQAAATKSKVSRPWTVDKSGNKPMKAEDFKRYLQETSGPCATWPTTKTEKEARLILSGQTPRQQKYARGKSTQNKQWVASPSTDPSIESKTDTEKEARLILSGQTPRQQKYARGKSTQNKPWVASPSTDSNNKPMSKEDFRQYLQGTSGPCSTWPKH